MPDTIVCSKCGATIEVTAALSAQVRQQVRAELESEARRRELVLAEREAELRRREETVQVNRLRLEEEVQRRVEAEQERIRKEVETKAHESVALELETLRGELSGVRLKLRQAQQEELELRRQRQQLEEEKAELELTVARAIDEQRQHIRASALKDADEEHRLRMAEKDKTIEDLRRQVEGLKRTVEQGSPQTRGEVMERELEDLLREAFPQDTIEPVPTSVRGGDVIQRVFDAAGRQCGIILWESKRTKNFQDSWLPKLREDQRAAHADVAVLVSAEMPRDCKTFGQLDGVWVTSRACMLGLAAALRAGLIEVARARKALEGQQTKAEVVMGYLTGGEFQRKVQGIAESLIGLQTCMDSEKRAMYRQWAKREKQLHRAIANTAALYGEVSGIIGASLPQIECLDMDALTDESRADESESEPAAPWA